jgi:hypothetical protein
MKNLIFLIILSILTFNSFAQIPAHLKYIRFLQIGISEHMINNPLTISTEPIDRSIILQRSTFGEQPKRLIGIDTDSLTEHFAVTDYRTYKIIQRFIKKSNFLNKTIYKHKKTDDFGTFLIIINTKIKYFLTSENSKAFFTDLIHYLKKEKCDSKVIDGLAEQVGANTPASTSL